MNSGQVVVLVATLVAMAANWVSRFGNRSALEHWSKPLATIGVIGLALVSGADRGSVVWATLALLLCLGGDVALLPRVDKFVVGLASFLLGHLAFIGLFVHRGVHHPRIAGLVLVAMALMITTVGRVIVFSVSDPKLRKPVLGYLVVIAAMTTVGWATGSAWVAVGATAFVVSDAVLGWGEFVRKRPWQPIVIMVTYHLAIAALAVSIW
jgi:uncharacterized membrane protein YhhN